MHGRHVRKYHPIRPHLQGHCRGAWALGQVRILKTTGRTPSSLFQIKPSLTTYSTLIPQKNIKRGAWPTRASLAPKFLWPRQVHGCHNPHCHSRFLLVPDRHASQEISPLRERGPMPGPLCEAERRRQRQVWYIGRSDQENRCKVTQGQLKFGDQATTVTP